eukprot:3332431-Prymnesium_polylepis.1
MLAVGGSPGIRCMRNWSRPRRVCTRNGGLVTVDRPPWSSSQLWSPTTRLNGIALAHSKMCTSGLSPPCTPASADLIRLQHRSTLRCIAERLLPDGHEPTYLQKEVANEKTVCQPATKRYHIYCSPKNIGALELIQEFTNHQGLTFKLGPSSLDPARRRSSARSSGERSAPT